MLTGWNVVDFDLAVLDRIAARERVPLELGRGPGGLRLRRPGSGRGAPGERARPRGARRHPAPARRLRPHGRLRARRGRAQGAGRGQDARGPRPRRRDPACCSRRTGERLVEYNRTDARLALEILERLRLVELAVERSRLTGMPLDRVASSIAAFDFLYLSRAGSAPHRRAERAARERRARAAGGRPRPRAAARALPQRRGARLQEPLPEPHPHVPDRPLEPAAARGRPGGGRPDRRARTARRSRARKGILPEILDELMPRARGGARAPATA